MEELTSWHGTRTWREKTMNAKNILTATVIAGFVFASPLQAIEKPTYPHEFFNQRGMCGDCHVKNEKNENGVERALVENITEYCTGCHTAEERGRSHPLGVSVRDRFRDMNVPEALPLENDDTITCVTCHNPHLDRFITARINGQDEPVFLDKAGQAFYKSYYLRMTDYTNGYTPLCLSCHSDH
jgi:predicted CXXCH cytochrome family protein